MKTGHNYTGVHLHNSAELYFRTAHFV